MKKLPSLTPARGAHRAPKPERKSTLLSVLAIFSVSAFVAVPLSGPSGMSATAAWYEGSHADSVTLLVSGQDVGLDREEFGVVGGYGVAPAVGTPDPGTAQALAFDLVIARGWSESEFSCLSALWKKESGWNHFAMNRSSGAYGIPQALPGEKMASAGSDWATNPATQIQWGLGYIEGRYGTPCAAWGHSQAKNWY